MIPILASMFLHGSWWHVIGNMWMLWLFGDNIEDYLGHFAYLIFYLLCGVAAAFTHIVFNANSIVPTVGASGAIAGIMGAYLSALSASSGTDLGFYSHRPIACVDLVGHLGRRAISQWSGELITAGQP